MKNIIEFKNMTKAFPGVIANDSINLSIREGEIHAVVGENGAGKTTLMKLLYGLYEPTNGELIIRGNKADNWNPSTAIKNGIGMVHQHFMLVPSFTVAENIVLGSEPKKKRLFTDFKKSEDIVNDLVDKYGLVVNPKLKVKDVTVGIQQRIEILKTLYKGADIIILDEPTAVLTPQETEELFVVIRKLVKELNKTVIIITHKLQEVLSLSDRVSVMRQGKMIGTIDTEDATEEILAEMMVGREVLLEELHREDKLGEVLLETKNVKARDNRGLTALDDINISIKAGEILGIAGVEGNGQSELMDVLSGLKNVESGEIYVNGKQVEGKTPKEIRKIGLAHIPEDRLITGLSKEASITENIMMGIQNKEPYAVKGMHLNMKAIREKAEKLIAEFDVRTPSQDIAVGKLSGGNMQKVVIAREFAFNTPVLIISQPTRGVDIGAIEFIHEQIIKKRNEGCAILLISAELDEIFRLSDRIITLYEGKVTGEFKNGEITKQQIGYYMTGNRTSEDKEKVIK